MKKQKRDFVIAWTERRFVVIEAFDREDAMERFLEGKFAQKNVEINEGPDDIIVETI